MGYLKTISCSNYHERTKNLCLKEKIIYENVILLLCPNWGLEQNVKILASSIEQPPTPLKKLIDKPKIKWSSTSQGYEVSNSTPKYWSMKFFLVEAAAAALPSDSVCWSQSEPRVCLGSSLEVDTVLENWGKNSYLHRRDWLERLQFLLKHSHHLQPALVGILTVANAHKREEGIWNAGIWWLI